MYKKYSKFHNKQVGQYLEGISVLKFEKFHLLVTLFYFYFFTIFYHSQFK